MIELKTETLILQQPVVTLVEQLPETVVNVVPERGPKGQKGDQGPEGEGAQTVVIADQAVQGHHIVGYAANGQLQHASNDNLDFASTTLGLTLNAALVGEEVTVATNREVQHSGWSWIVGQPIFLGTMGMMTQVPPDVPAAFLLQVGFATAPDKMWVEVEIGIEL